MQILKHIDSIFKVDLKISQINFNLELLLK